MMRQGMLGEFAIRNFAEEGALMLGPRHLLALNARRAHRRWWYAGNSGRDGQCPSNRPCRMTFHSFALYKPRMAAGIVAAVHPQGGSKADYGDR
jgi:hypothetical protein